jgi:hypothetical protein
MAVCPLTIGGQIVSNGILMTIQTLNFETCISQCIYYDTCLMEFRATEIAHSCLMCKIKQIVSQTNRP